MRYKSPFTLLFYKPPTSAHNILIIEELAFCQFCLLCALVRLWVELTCIRRTTDQQMMASTPDDGEHTGNISQFYEPCWFLRFSNHHQREDEEDQWVDFDDWNNSLNAGTLIHEEIIPDLENQLEIEGKVENTWIQSITSSQYSVDNFSNFKFDKRSEVCKCDR